MSVPNDSEDQTPSIRQVEGLELPIPPAVPIPSIENPEGATFVVEELDPQWLPVEESGSLDTNLP